MGRLSSDANAEHRDTTSGRESTSERAGPGPSESLAPDLSSLPDSLASIQRSAADKAIGPQSDGPATRGQYAQRYGVDIDTPGQVERLQRLEQSNSLETVQRWADEGIPIEAMGTPSKMQAFRQRKGTPVPWNVEQQNTQSVQRSTRAAADTTPAGETNVPDSVRDVVSSPGQPVDAALRKPVESEIGQSLEHARVHRSPAADAACDQLNARAFTLKNHVAVRSDQPDPDTPAGQRLMSHELTHVGQQTGGAVSMLPDTEALEIDPDPQLEQEAEDTAQRVMSGGEVGIQRMSDTDVHVQRSLLGRGSRGAAYSSENRSDPDDSTIDPSLRHLGLSRTDNAMRRSRIRGEDGIGTDGRKIPGAMQQVGASCWLAALQAAWAAVGADTSSLRKLIEHYPSSDKGKMVTSLQLSLGTSLDSMFKRVTDIDEDIKKRVLKEAGGLETTFTRLFDDVKGVALALANLYQLKRDTQGSDGASPLVTDEDLQIGRNVLHMVSHNSRLTLLAEKWDSLYPSSDMGKLKTKFMEIVGRFGTPLTLIYYSNPDGTIFASPGDLFHITTVVSVSVSDNARVFVTHWDSENKPGQYETLPLTALLKPRYSPEISTRFRRCLNPFDRLLVGKMRSDADTKSKLTNA